MEYTPGLSKILQGFICCWNLLPSLSLSQKCDVGFSDVLCNEMFVCIDSVEMKTRNRYFVLASRATNWYCTV